MKTKFSILVFVSLLIFSCAPVTPTQANEVVEIVTEEIVTEAPATQESITTEESIVTEEPTEAPITCVTLLTPVDGGEIPPVGKVTFSWTVMDEAGKYVLNIILPTGDVVPFETDKSTYDRYMEAFVFGGEYQWQVIAQGIDGNEICVSEIAKFNKSAYQAPQSNNSNNGGNSDESTSDNNGGTDDGPGGGSGSGSGGCNDGSPCP